MSDFLDQMARASRKRAREARCLPRAEVPVRSLCLDGFDLIAEIKLSAPSSGVLASPSDPLAATVTQALAYESGAVYLKTTIDSLNSRVSADKQEMHAIAETLAGMNVMQFAISGRK